MAKFKFSDKQAVAILEMKLQSLANLERQKVEDELKEKQKLIKDLRALLADPKKLLKVVQDELLAIREKYGDQRRTKVVARAAKVMSDEDLVEAKDQVMVLTKGGYVKRTDPEAYRAQKRGGSGSDRHRNKRRRFREHFRYGQYPRRFAFLQRQRQGLPSENV